MFVHIEPKNYGTTEPRLNYPGNECLFDDYSILNTMCKHLFCIF